MASKTSVTGTTYGVKFYFDDEALAPYQRRADQHLDTILEALDIGAATNMGYAKVQWLPDEVARVRYLVMEGVLEPIITVKIEYQEEAAKQKREGKLEETLEKIEEEKKDDDPTYKPYMWVGIGTVGHALESHEGNDYCDWWQFPTEARMYAFEPQQDEDTPLTFANCVEHCPGLIYSGRDWDDNMLKHFPDSEADQQLLVEVGDTYGYYNEAGDYWAPWNHYQWPLTYPQIPGYQYSHWVNVARNSGMMAAEFAPTAATAPPEAYDDDYGPGHFYRSIVVDSRGISFPGAPPDEGGPWDQNAVVQTTAFMLADTPGIETIMEGNFTGGTIPCRVLSGEYEIGATAMNYECECTTANLHIRVVLGESGGVVHIYDIFPQGVGQTSGNHIQNQYRSAILGGAPGYSDLCQSDGGWEVDLPYGGQSGNEGWWDESIFVNILTGTVRVGKGTRNQPFFDFSCPDTAIYGGDHPGCTAKCEGDDLEEPLFDYDYPGELSSNLLVTYKEKGTIKTLDLRGGIAWHMARVVQVHNTTGHACYVKLCGNDGAQCDDSPFAPKPCCRACAYHNQGRWRDCEGECKPFMYGHTFRALGLDPSVNVFSNTPNYDPHWLYDIKLGKYSVGQLCVVVGHLGGDDNPCGKIITWGTPGVIVTTPQGSGQDFTQPSWSRYRCPEYDLTAGGKFSGHRARPISYIEALKLRYKCEDNSPSEPDPFLMKCGCVKGQFTCWEDTGEDEGS